MPKNAPQNDKPLSPWPIEGATVKLARNKRVQTEEGKDKPYHRPPAIDGSIRIGMDAVIFVPDLTAQKSGFTPYKLEPKPQTEDEQKAEKDIEFMAVDATDELMRHYAGIYKYVQPLGESNDN